MEPNQILPIPVRRKYHSAIQNESRPGQFLGQQLFRVSGASSQVRAAAEEVNLPRSAQFAKSLSERSFRLSQVRPQLIGENAVVAAGRRQQAVLDKIKRMVVHFRKQRKMSTTELLEEIKQEFGEVSEQDAALGFAIKLFRSQPENRNLVSNLIAVRKLLRESQSEEEFAPGFESEESDLPFETGSGARELVGQIATKADTTVVDVYELVEDLFGEGQIEEGLSFLLQDLGPQVSAASSGRDLGQLKRLIDRLFYVQVLSGIQSSLKRLEERMFEHFEARWKLSPAAVLKHILMLTQRDLPTSEAISSLADQLGIQEPQSRIYFLLGLREHIRQFPLKIYANHDYRRPLLDAAQQALDISIQEENTEIDPIR